MKLKDYRKQKGLTQKQLAEKLGVRQQRISEWERQGKTIEQVKQEAGMKDIILRFEKFVDKDGNKKARLVSFENVINIDKLPERYTSEYPYFFERGRHVYVCPERYAGSYDLQYPVTENQLNELLKAMRIGANRLHQIRNEIRKTKEEWNGEMEVRI